MKSWPQLIMNPKVVPPSTSSNPNPNYPYQPMQAFHFIRFMSHMNKQSTNSITGRRSHSVRLAAFASMAFAVGPRRVWTRALLHRLRGQGRKGRNRVLGKRGGVRRGCKVDEKLRRLVPGGRRMDLRSLLEEAVDYIQCLHSQVKLMQNIAGSYENCQE